MKNTIKTIILCAIVSGGSLFVYHNFANKSLTQEVTEQENVENTTQHTTPSGFARVDFTQAAEQGVHSVVHVKNLSYRKSSHPLADFFYGYHQQKPQIQVGTGSGVIISSDGYIVTNHHVIEGASKIEITLNSNKSYEAQVIGTDQAMDIALLKIQPEEKLPYSRFGNSDDIKIGEWVLAIGNPYNLNSTVTAGIVSAKARSLSSNSIQSFIQTDAAVNPGNSGGALVNTRGELIGINTMISSNTGSYVGYSFAVPANQVQRIVEDLKKYGKVQRGYIGIEAIGLTPQIAENYHLPTSEGIYIARVLRGSGAHEAQLQSGDIIVSIDGKPIRAFKDLIQKISEKRPNDYVQIDYLRGDEKHSVQVQIK